MNRWHLQVKAKLEQLETDPVSLHYNANQLFIMFDDVSTQLVCRYFSMDRA
jgi:hypothetical protein